MLFVGRLPRGLNSGVSASNMPYDTPDDSNGSDDLRRVLNQYAPKLSEAAESADDRETADVYAVLAAVARGRSPPEDAASRIVDRVQNRGK